MRWVGGSTLVFVSSCLLGCLISEHADEEPQPSPPQRVAGPQVRALEMGTPPAELFDTKGRRWSLRRVHSTWKTEPSDVPNAIDDSPSLAKLSDEELAEGLRPVRLHGHGKYVGEYLLDISMPEQIKRVRDARAMQKAQTRWVSSGPVDVARTVGMPNANVNLIEETLGSVFSQTLDFAPRARAARYDPTIATMARSGVLGPDNGLYHPRPNDFWNALDPAKRPIVPMDPTSPRNLYLDPNDNRSFAFHFEVSLYPWSTAVAQATVVSGSTIKNSHCS